MTSEYYTSILYTARYAENIAKILSSSHDLKVSNMKDIDINHLKNCK